MWIIDWFCCCEAWLASLLHKSRCRAIRKSPTSSGAPFRMLSQIFWKKIWKRKKWSQLHNRRSSRNVLITRDHLIDKKWQSCELAREEKERNAKFPLVHFYDELNWNGKKQSRRSPFTLPFVSCWWRVLLGWQGVEESIWSLLIRRTFWSEKKTRFEYNVRLKIEERMIWSCTIKLWTFIELRWGFKLN